MKRGIFIVIEGCDKSGKSTQCELLVNCLKERGILVEAMSFPVRGSISGETIAKYLSMKTDLPDESIHLMFAANRWELKNRLVQLLTSGVSVVVDRYSFSGIAYSVAKGLDYKWCAAAENGLPKPDVVFYLKASSTIEELSQRNSFGAERYEVVEFQRKVAEVFNKMSHEEHQSYWYVLDAVQNVDDTLKVISSKTLKIMEYAQKEPIHFFNF